jgi:hypothetical protein
MGKYRGITGKHGFSMFFPMKLWGVLLKKVLKNQCNDVWIMDVLNSHGEYEGS